jgi:hypothetical protein
MPVVDLADVLGLILRGYTMPAARYLGLTVCEPRAARAFLGTLITSDTADVSVTTAQPWKAKPQCCVNLGITFPSLAALGCHQFPCTAFPRNTRRGITYGPPYDPARPRDGKDRGLLGLFIGVSLRDQFEFLMAEWADDGIFTARLGGTKDPLIGAQADSTGSFSIPSPEGPMVLPGLPRFVTPAVAPTASCRASPRSATWLTRCRKSLIPALPNTSVHSGQ